MVSRKRGRQEMEADDQQQQQSSVAVGTQEQPLLERIRNMWEFANLGQYLFTFGKAIRIEEDVNIEDFETECLKPGHAPKLSEIGLALLKFVSSHRGLTPDMFDEYTRRQYESRLPARNPFGTEEQPKSFADFDIFTKIRILWQLSQWTMIHSDRIRERMPEQKDTEQSFWRIEPTGWDADERTYLVLDDNRLYRCTEPVLPTPPAPKPKKNSKKAKQMERAARKRRKLSEATAQENGVDEAEGQEPTTDNAAEDDGLGGRKWECVAVTLEQYRQFLASMRRTKNPNEKVLLQSLTDDVLPIVEKAEEEQQRKIAKRQKELVNLEKLATAKRSSRIAGKAERQREEEEAVEAEKKRKADLVMAKKEQEKLKKMEEERETRIVTREQRVKEREMRRVLHEQELANLSEDSKKLEAGEGRVSGRHLRAEMEKRKKALEELAQESDWMFDCSGCGVYGENLDDGTGIIACEKCNVWQHLACLGLSPETAEQKDFHFLCNLCKRREEDKQKSAKNPIKLDFRKLGSSASPPSDKTERRTHLNGDGLHAKRSADDEAYSTSPSPKKPKFQENGYLESTARVSKSPTHGQGAPGSAPSVLNAGASLPNGSITARAAPQGFATNGDHTYSSSGHTASYGRTPASAATNGTTVLNGLVSAGAREGEQSHASMLNDPSPRAESASSPQQGLGLFSSNSFDRPIDTNAQRQGALSPTKPSARFSMSPTSRGSNKEDLSSSPRVGFPQSGGSPNSVLAPPQPLGGALSISSPFSPSTVSPSKPSGVPPPSGHHTVQAPADPVRRSPTSPGSIFQSPSFSAHLSPNHVATMSGISSSMTPATSNLPDPRSGISPTKQASPPRPTGSSPASMAPAQASITAINESHPVLPPGPALSPTNRPVDLTPPRKALTPEQQSHSPI